MHPLPGYKLENILTRMEWAAVLPWSPVTQGLGFLPCVPQKIPDVFHPLSCLCDLLLCSFSDSSLHLLIRMAFPSFFIFPSTDFSSLFQVNIFHKQWNVVIMVLPLCCCCFFLWNLSHHRISHYLSHQFVGCSKNKWKYSIICKSYWALTSLHTEYSIYPKCHIDFHSQISAKKGH